MTMFSDDLDFPWIRGHVPSARSITVVRHRGAVEVHLAGATEHDRSHLETEIRTRQPNLDFSVSN